MCGPELAETPNRNTSKKYCRTREHRYHHLKIREPLGLVMFLGFESRKWLRCSFWSPFKATKQGYPEKKTSHPFSHAHGCSLVPPESVTSLITERAMTRPRESQHKQSTTTFSLAMGKQVSLKSPELDPLKVVGRVPNLPLKTPRIGEVNLLQTEIAHVTQKVEKSCVFKR